MRAFVSQDRKTHCYSYFGGSTQDPPHVTTVVSSAKHSSVLRSFSLHPLVFMFDHAMVRHVTPVVVVLNLV